VSLILVLKDNSPLLASLTTLTFNTLNYNGESMAGKSVALLERLKSMSRTEPL
jgi:hypothetical protein